jgi:hypothetical protein
MFNLKQELLFKSEHSCGLLNLPSSVTTWVLDFETTKTESQLSLEIKYPYGNTRLAIALVFLIYVAYLGVTDYSNPRVIFVLIILPFILKGLVIGSIYAKSVKCLITIHNGVVNVRQEAALHETIEIEEELSSYDGILVWSKESQHIGSRTFLGRRQNIEHYFMVLLHSDPSKSVPIRHSYFRPDRDLLDDYAKFLGLSIIGETLCGDVSQRV